MAEGPLPKRHRADEVNASATAPATFNTCSSRLALVGMPADFNALLGPFSDPDEAHDLEDLVPHQAGADGGTGSYLDFDQLPPPRQEALLQSVRTLAAKAFTAESPAHLERLRVKASRLPKFKDTARKSELTAAYRRLVSTGELTASQSMDELLVRKKGRSHSGVLVITTFFGPGEFSCPKDCHYCPNQPGIARSYLLKEPAVLRGFRNGWDPIRQFRDRAGALDKNGHVVDKVEVIILGGTFSFYPKPYAEAFIAATFYAANTYYDVRDETGGASGLEAQAGKDGTVAAHGLRPMRTLSEEIELNETAQCRIIGVTVETRPDYINPRELRRFRELGVTRVQLGIQHLDDNILTMINRDCPTIKTVGAIRQLLDAGFKVDAHWMPDLPGSSYAQDREMFELLFSPENESFQVDQWKVYPTATVPYTKISEWYKEGFYKPYAEQDGGKQMVELLLYIMANCPYRIRLNRIIRDIPTTYIIGGERRVNLRQIIEKTMKERQIKCNDIRERECKGQPMHREHARIFTDELRASDGTEFYLSVEDEARTQLYGHLRLRLRDDATDPARNIFPVLTGCALIRELHTYGKLVAVCAVNTGAEVQHVGVGSQLMHEAEHIARSRGFRRVAVIAGVGARGYYVKHGYHLEETYMVKTLPDSPVEDLSDSRAADATLEGQQLQEQVAVVNARATGTTAACVSSTGSKHPGVRQTMLTRVKRFFGFGKRERES